MRHKLTNKDLVNMTAHCSYCGDVAIVHHHKDKMRCKNKAFQEGRRKRLKLYKETFDVKERIYNCEICGKTEEENGKGLAIDHCHETNIFRGYLCGACNLGLGSFRDNPEILKKAIIYLKEKGGK